MRKFFVDRKNIKDSQVIIIGDDIKHIVKVLRKGIGDMLTVSDGQGWEYEVRISQIENEKITTELIRKIQVEVQTIDITLYQALPKLDKMDNIIQKCTELGISKIVPFISEYTIVNVDDKKSDKKVERWRKIALEACKQCGRSKLPEIDNIYSIENILGDIRDYDLCVFAYEKDNSSIKKLLKENIDARKIAIVIGPEGGFSEKEARRIIEAGAKSIGLGPRILRTETAGMTVLCVIMYELGDIAK